MLCGEFGLGLDALRPLQPERLKQALRHAYDRQAPYRAKRAAAGVPPGDLRTVTM